MATVALGKLRLAIGALASGCALSSGAADTEPRKRSAPDFSLGGIPIWSAAPADQASSKPDLSSWPKLRIVRPIVERLAHRIAVYYSDPFKEEHLTPKGTVTVAALLDASFASMFESVTPLEAWPSDAVLGVSGVMVARSLQIEVDYASAFMIRYAREYRAACVVELYSTDGALLHSWTRKSDMDAWQGDRQLLSAGETKVAMLVNLVAGMVLDILAQKGEVDRWLSARPSR